MVCLKRIKDLLALCRAQSSYLLSVWDYMGVVNFLNENRNCAVSGSNSEMINEQREVIINWWKARASQPLIGLLSCLSGTVCVCVCAGVRIPGFMTITCMRAQSLQSCPTLCDLLDHGPPGSSVHGILQARVLQWVAISFSSHKLWSEWSEVTQSCPTECNPKDCSLPGSSVHGIFQATVLEWVPFPSPMAVTHCGK